MTFVSWHVCNSRVKVGYTICWWNLSWDKIDFKDARMGRAGRVRHDTHVNMSWNHVHIAVEISKFLFSRLIWNSLAFWSPLRACAAFTLSANYLLVLPAIMHEYLLTLPFSPYFPWEFQGRQLGAIIVRFEQNACRSPMVRLNTSMAKAILPLHTPLDRLPLEESPVTSRLEIDNTKQMW